VTLDKTQAAAARPEIVGLPEVSPGPIARGPAANPQPASPEVIEVPDARAALGMPWFGAPVAGDVGLDLALVERGVHAFFARLASLEGEGGHPALTNGIAASWLTAVAAVAFEIARARDKARRSSLGADGATVLGCTATGERE
jgi:hypothetical protein